MISGTLNLIGSAVVLAVIVLNLTAAAKSARHPSEERTAMSLRMMAMLACACAFKWSIAL